MKKLPQKGSFFYWKIVNSRKTVQPEINIYLTGTFSLAQSGHRYE